MKRLLILSTLFFTALSSLLADAPTTNEPSVIPRPTKLEVQPGSLTINANMMMDYDQAFQNEANLLAAKLRTATGFPFSRSVTISGTIPLTITLTANGAQDLGEEGYTLDVNAHGITIRAKTAAGIFYGTQTLLQLLPPQIFTNHQVSGVTWSVPYVHIEDRPALAYRGFMLDESRHFFGKATVEALLDQLALLKFNVFHWHLTDDNGWRVEIKKYPQLTTIGAWRERVPERDGSGDARYGGFYTQDDIREIVAYAAARHITIVPEIDMPGHMAAAMAAYPELAPDNGWTPHVSQIGTPRGRDNYIGSFALCVAKPLTVKFCEDVLDEICALFPSPYIHIGGDEVDFKQWEKDKATQAAMQQLGIKNPVDLQVRFQNEIIAYLESKGRHAIVWNNTYSTKLDKRAVNQFWRWNPPMLHAAEFARDGYKIITSDKAIFYYDQHSKIENIYKYQPLASELSQNLWNQELGAEACVWAERLPDATALEHNVFPFIFAHAEVLWTSPERKDFQSFIARLPAAIQRCQTMGVSVNQSLVTGAQ